METEKNLHAAIPSALLTEMEATAEASSITLDELVQQAVKGYISDRSWAKLYAYGEAQAHRLGYREEDVDRLIHEYREEERDRKNKENGR